MFYVFVTTTITHTEISMDFMLVSNKGPEFNKTHLYCVPNFSVINFCQTSELKVM
jgi:hypothetical protein